MIAIIGDIHGNIENLKIVLDKCKSIGVTKYIFLGDYGDRGKNSKEVISLLIKMKEELKDNCILLRGNHEEMLIGAVCYNITSLEECWLDNGGKEFIKSYSSTYNQLIDNYPSLLISHAKYLKNNTKMYHTEIKDNILFFFCHNMQKISIIDKIIKNSTVNEEDINIWDRAYYPHQMPNNAIQVYGHTTYNIPRIALFEENDSRGAIGIDTGSCFSNGYLTALILKDDGDISFIYSKEVDKNESKI